MLTAKRSISSRVTIQNPRPRKYASAAERQKALRERFPTLCVRVEQEQADFMKRIADEQGRTLQDVHLAFIKYANGRGNQWLTQGLKGFAPLPRFEETPKENPMKRKPTPAQIAARERFAEMARSGAFKKKASKARKKNPLTYGLDGVVNITDTYERSVGSSRNLAEHYANQLRMRGREDIVYVVFGITPEAKAQAGRYRNGVTITLNPRDYEIAYAFHPTQGEISRQLKAQRDAERRAYTRQGMKLKPNPAKKTVSQKISQLTREGYPQKQAVAIALSEERAGKVKRNPSRSGIGFEGYDPYASIDRLDEYRQKSDAELRYIIQDAGEAARAQRGMSSEAKYLDQVNDATTVLYERRLAREKAIAASNRSGRKIGKREASSINRLLTGRSSNPRASNPVKPKKQRMLNISWLTPGGQREMKSVPIDFVFTHYVGNVAERFFVRTENGQLIVSEYSTGGRVGQVPYTMRAAALNDRNAAKRYVGEMLSRIGAERFKAAVKKFEPIN